MEQVSCELPRIRHQQLLEFTVSLIGSPADPVRVDYETLDASAKLADGDYLAVSGELNWEPGDTTPKIIQVPVVGDTVFETNEAVLVRLMNATGAVLGKHFGWGTIVNDDPLSYVAPSDGQPNDIEVRLDGSYVELIRNNQHILGGMLSEPIPISIIGAPDVQNSLIVSIFGSARLLANGLAGSGDDQ